MRLATWNVNGLRARLDFIKIWLRQRSPDVVGMQELKVEEPDFPAEEFESLGYQHAIHVQKGWNGVGILSKHPMEVTQGGLPGEVEMGARLITADIAGPRGLSGKGQVAGIALGILQCQINGSQTFDPVWRLQCDAGSYRLLER